MKNVSKYYFWPLELFLFLSRGEIFKDIEDTWRRELLVYEKYAHVLVSLEFCVFLRIDEKKNNTKFSFFSEALDVPRKIKVRTPYSLIKEKQPTTFIFLGNSTVSERNAQQVFYRPKRLVMAKKSKNRDK